MFNHKFLDEFGMHDVTVYIPLSYRSECNWSVKCGLRLLVLRRAAFEIGGSKTHMSFIPFLRLVPVVTFLMVLTGSFSPRVFLKRFVICSKLSLSLGSFLRIISLAGSNISRIVLNVSVFLRKCKFNETCQFVLIIGVRISDEDLLELMYVMNPNCIVFFHVPNI